MFEKSLDIIQLPCIYKVRLNFKSRSTCSSRRRCIITQDQTLVGNLGNQACQRKFDDKDENSQNDQSSPAM